jgi:CheY-like chemotaxis protein
MATENPLPHPLSVLVVDDDSDTVESLAELLRYHGHVVRVARGGEEALRSAEADPPDAVLLDLMMPRMTGCAVARALRERDGTGKRPFLVAVTGCGHADDMARTADAGFDVHLVKPVDPGVIVGLLERFRRLLSPPTPVNELDPPEEPPDSGGAGDAPATGSRPDQSDSDPPSTSDSPSVPRAVVSFC